MLFDISLERAAAGYLAGNTPLYHHTSRVTVFHIVRTLSAECRAGFLEQCTTKEKSFESLRVATSHTLWVYDTFPKKKKNVTG